MAEAGDQSKLYGCVYCRWGQENFSKTVLHVVNEHSNQEVKIKTFDNESQIINFKIIPEICYEQGRVLSVNEDQKKIHLSRINVQPKDSPFKKICKITNDKKAENQEVITNDLCEDIELTACEETDILKEDPQYSKLLEMLPSVLDTLKDCGEVENFVAFHELLSEKKFPLDNIAYLLFIDVVRWLNLDKSTNFMRYSDNVKMFWRTGFRLFRGKFLRFMGGPKNSGQIINKEGLCGRLDPLDAKINFVVPNRKVLVETSQIVPMNKPGILQAMIDTVATIDDETATYKICVDGKKINPSSSGEVDLWGHEQSPTYEEKQTRLKEELCKVSQIRSFLEKLSTLWRTSTSSLSLDEKEHLTNVCRHLISVLSCRIRDLRKSKMGKDTVLDKLQKKCEGDWRDSRYSMVISSIRTHIYQLENCLEDLLLCNEHLCEIAAQIVSLESSYSKRELVNLQLQTNIVCLPENPNENEPALVKQRSEKWFQIRDKVLTTGSTIPTAIGLQGLKNQRNHLEIKSGKKTLEAVSEDIQKRFDHGTKNEVNAVATFAATFLPAFHPQTSFYEEGCYVLRHEESPVLVVSPDGSVRQNGANGKPLYGVEIKCPYPGKLFCTPVQYTIPWYYVTQILSEMKSLGVEYLYFVSFSKNSTAIHLAQFDEELWMDIYAEIINVDANNPMKKLKPETKAIRKRIDQYCKEKVQFVAELKSKFGIPCSHSHTEEKRIRHDLHPTEEESSRPNVVKALQKTLLRVSELLTECHKLCAQKASEVLVFLMGDLDRKHQTQTAHAYPIAYALKGYSMRSEAMRTMIQQVLKTLFLSGIYVPVVSYDGQWASLAFHTPAGEPLTLLELQKQVYNEVKKISKAQMVKMIAERCLVKTTTIHDLQQTVEFEKDTCTGSIVVGMKLFVNPFFTTQNTALLMSKAMKNKSKEPPQKSVDTAVGEVERVLSSLTPEVMSSLDDDFIASLQVMDSTSTVTSTENDIDLGEIHLDGLDESDGAYVHPAETSGDSDDASEAEKKDGDTIADGRSFLYREDLVTMLSALKTNSKGKRKWDSESIESFTHLLADHAGLGKRMTKRDMLICLEAVGNALSAAGIVYFKSWSKEKLLDLLHAISNGRKQDISVSDKRTRRKSASKLMSLCRKFINGLPKLILNSILAENVIVERINRWRNEGPFCSPTRISGIGELMWFSSPEFNSDTSSYIFSFLDMHHLITNCRVKVCKDGFPERNIHKAAWMHVAKENKTSLKIPHVEDLVDKQSDGIARQTFSNEVESEMQRLGYNSEALFCRLIREFHEAEDDPGLSAHERCNRRLRFRSWLLEGVQFTTFPPYGSHVRGIPNIMFQGFLTNIERRIQIFPYVKSGNYNVRSLGTLEAENLFGEFQDLDPKGSGVIRAEEVPAALETACQLLKTQLDPERPFHMSLSKAKVYPVHELMEECLQTERPGNFIYLYPSVTREIIPLDNMFDTNLRAKRKPKRRLVGIAKPSEAARGVAPVRQFHKCDESKILAHKRLGIDLNKF